MYFHIISKDSPETYKLTVYVIDRDNHIELNSYDTFEDAQQCVIDISAKMANNTSYYEIV